MKKCCERFRRGECTNPRCPFPHVIEATKIKPHSTKITQKLEEIRDEVETMAQRNAPIFDLTSHIEISIQVFEGVSPADYCVVRNCKDCFIKFNLTKGDVNFYKSKDLHLPKRCKTCRERRRIPPVLTFPLIK
eukprot:gene6762-7472_t